MNDPNLEAAYDSSYLGPEYRRIIRRLGKLLEISNALPAPAIRELSVSVQADILNTIPSDLPLTDSWEHLLSGLLRQAIRDHAEAEARR